MPREAERTHRAFVEHNLEEVQISRYSERMEGEHSEVEWHMRPRVLKAMPPFIQEWVSLGVESGGGCPRVLESSSTMVFYAIRSSQSVVLDEWRDLLDNISPLQSLSELNKARTEMAKWKQIVEDLSLKKGRFISLTHQLTGLE